MKFRIILIIVAALFSTPAYAICYGEGIPTPGSTHELVGAQEDNQINISGGCIDGTAIGSTTPSTGSFTTLTTTGTVAHNGALNNFGSANSVPAHITSGQATPPALTSCGTGTPAITGTDTAGVVTMGTSATGCVITFNVTYVSAPYCVVTWQATPLASQSYTVAAGAITTVQTSTSSNLLNYHCVGQAGG